MRYHTILTLQEELRYITPVLRTQLNEKQRGEAERKAYRERGRDPLTRVPDTCRGAARLALARPVNYTAIRRRISYYKVTCIITSTGKRKDRHWTDQWNRKTHAHQEKSSHAHGVPMRDTVTQSRSFDVVARSLGPTQPGTICTETLLA